ncbi:MAG: haloacid dehalogenase type II [Rhizobiaceae bacterium]|nr:haloacid dehalogenase type II [Rhizobiaceae bacterium]
MSAKAYVFDAYGTLFDVHSAVSRHSDLVGENPARVSEIWRNKQLEYTWTRSGMDRYVDFWSLTEQALDFALSIVPGSNSDCKKILLDAYMTLDCYPEVPSVLKKLKESGAKTAILSNGSPDMLSAAVNSAGLADLLDHQFSVDEIGVFKTDPSTYAMVTDEYGFQPAEIAFQSSNRWDVAGAVAFGFKCNWINRTGQPDEYLDLGPKRTLNDLNGLF